MLLSEIVVLSACIAATSGKCHREMKHHPCEDGWTAFRTPRISIGVLMSNLNMVDASMSGLL